MAHYFWRFPFSSFKASHIFCFTEILCLDRPNAVNISKMSKQRGRKTSAVPQIAMQMAASTSELASLVTKGAFKAGKSDGPMSGWMSLPKIKMGGCCSSAKVSGRATSQHKFILCSQARWRGYIRTCMRHSVAAGLQSKPL
jgi:hypothetical protein